MISNLNKVLIFLMFLSVLFAFTVTGRGDVTYQVMGPPHCKGLKPFTYDPYCVWVEKGQEAVYTSVGFVLTGKLEFHGYYGGNGAWGIGKGLTIIPIDKVLYKHLADLEGKKVRIRVEEVE